MHAISRSTARYRKIAEFIEKTPKRQQLGSDFWCSAGDYRYACRRAAAQIDALNAGLAYHPGQSGPVGLFAAAQATLHDAIRAYVTYSNRMMDGAKFSVSLNDRRATFKYLHDRSAIQFDEAFVVGACISTVRTARRTAVPLAVVLRGADREAAHCAAALDVEVRPGLATSISFDVSDFDAAMPNADAALADALEQSLSALPAAQGATDLVERLREQVGRNVSKGAPQTLEGHAAMLGVSPRTLQRRLSDSGVQLSTIRDQVREREACRLLLETDTSINDIADDLGFNSTGAFFRAFRRWRACSPGRYRQRHGSK